MTIGELKNIEKNIDDKLIEHAIINQIDADILDSEFSAYSELIAEIMKLKGGKKTLLGYLGSSALDNLKEGKTEKRY